MDPHLFSALDEEITREDWERTPTSVKRLVRFLLEDVECRLAALEEDKILSNIERERSSGGRAKKWVVDSEKILCCSFCVQSSEKGLRIVVGPDVNICNECVDVCNEILAEPE